MTQLTDKMEGLRYEYPEPKTKEDKRARAFDVGFHAGVDKCLALAEAEEEGVGDWEAELEGFIEALFDKHGESYEVYNPVAFTADIGKFITTLLATKDREIAEAYKKGFIDGGLQNLPDRPLNSERE